VENLNLILKHCLKCMKERLEFDSVHSAICLTYHLYFTDQQLVYSVTVTFFFVKRM